MDCENCVIRYECSPHNDQHDENQKKKKKVEIIGKWQRTTLGGVGVGSRLGPGRWVPGGVEHVRRIELAQESALHIDVTTLRMRVCEHVCVRACV